MRTVSLLQTVSSIMNTKPVLLAAEVSVSDACRLLSASRVDGAVVVDDEQRLIGIFTKHQIIRAVAEGKDLDGIRVGDVLRRDIVTARADDPIDSLRNYPGIGRIPVVDEDSKVIGVVTLSDLVGYFFDSYVDVSHELEIIINSLYNPILSIDKTGHIKLFNRAAEMLLGITRDQACGKRIVDVFSNSHLPQILVSGRPELAQRIELNNKAFMSNRSPIIRDGEVIGAVAVLQDISELEEISRELKYVKELNKELDAIIDSSFDGFFVTDGRGLTLRVNKAFERITGIAASELVGRTVHDIVANGLFSESVSVQVIERKEPVTIMQESKVGKVTLTTGSPVFAENGEIFRVVTNVRDITELNDLKRKLEKTRELSEHYETELKHLRLRYSAKESVVVNSPKMLDLLSMAVRLARVDSTVLITGESGVGKELVAEIVHRNSPRHGKPLIKINCGAIPDNLMETELFGYEEGAFTGARRQGKAGIFELADGGTIFLDEIGELPLGLQVKLLRVLQDRQVMRVGGVKPITVDVRIIAASNRDLEAMVKRKEFREDVFYRLNVVPLHVPPLRERKQEVAPLVLHFLSRFNQKYGLGKRVSPSAMDRLIAYQWPGNVRELENLVERLVVITQGDIIDVDSLPDYINDMGKETCGVSVTGILPLKEAVASVERQLLEKTITRYHSARKVGEKLGIDASTVVRKAARYGLKTR